VRVGLGSFAVELDGSGFLGCCSEVAGAMGKSEESAAVPIVMIKMQLLAFEHQLAASYAGCAVCMWE
jgi:hypothetical protein